MNNLQKIISELTPTFSYRIKFAWEPSKEVLSKVITRLVDRYDAYDVEPLKKTIFQVKPIDFYNLDAGEIWMFDFKCRRGIQPELLQFEIGALLKWPETVIHVRNNDEPYQIEIAASEDGDIDFDEECEPLLFDPEYTEHEDIDPELIAGQGRADMVVKAVLDAYKNERTPYSKYMAAGFKTKE